MILSVQGFSSLNSISSTQRYSLTKYKVYDCALYLNLSSSNYSLPLQSFSINRMASSLGISMIFTSLLFCVSPIILSWSPLNSILISIFWPSITLVFISLMFSYFVLLALSVVIDLILLVFKLVRLKSAFAILLALLLFSIHYLFIFQTSRVARLFCSLCKNRLFSSSMLYICRFLKMSLRLLLTLVRMFLVFATEQAPFVPITLAIFCRSSLFSRSISISLSYLIISLLPWLMTMVSACSMSLEFMGLISLRLMEWQESSISCSLILTNLFMQGLILFMCSMRNKIIIEDSNSVSTLNKCISGHLFFCYQLRNSGYFAQLLCCIII